MSDKYSTINVVTVLPLHVNVGNDKEYDQPQQNNEHTQRN
jgi:hypothetical protein